MAERDYYGFLDEVAEKLQTAQDPFSSQFRVNVKDVEKANGMSYRGIEVADGQTGMGVAINMDKHYKMYLAGKPVDEIVDLVQQQAADAFEKRPDVDISRVKDYESLCSNVMMALVSKEKNAEYLQNVPHFDMAVRKYTNENERNIHINAGNMSQQFLLAVNNEIKRDGILTFLEEMEQLKKELAASADKMENIDAELSKS